MLKFDQLIDGRFAEAITGRTCDRVERLTGDVASSTPASDFADIGAAVSAVRARSPLGPRRDRDSAAFC